MADPPLIDTQTLATSTDQQVAIQVVKRMREMWATKSYSAITTSANEIMPGPNVQSDDEILQYLLANAGSGFHCACTCELQHITDDYGTEILIPYARQNGQRSGCECSRHNHRQSQGTQELEGCRRLHLSSAAPWSSIGYSLYVRDHMHCLLT
jgi:hypothetical protein